LPECQLDRRPDRWSDCRISVCIASLGIYLPTWNRTLPHRSGSWVKLPNVPATTIIPLSSSMLVVPFKNAAIGDLPAWAKPASTHRCLGPHPERPREAGQALAITWRGKRPYCSPRSRPSGAWLYNRRHSLTIYHWLTPSKICRKDVGNSVHNPLTLFFDGVWRSRYLRPSQIVNAEACALNSPWSRCVCYRISRDWVNSQARLPPPPRSRSLDHGLAERIPLWRAKGGSKRISRHPVRRLRDLLRAQSETVQGKAYGIPRRPPARPPTPEKSDPSRRPRSRSR
jgi:hypothetical protein